MPANSMIQNEQGRGRAAPRTGRRLLAGCTIGVMCFLSAGRVQALDIPGVLPTSIGLPEANVVLRPTASAGPYTGVDSFDFTLTNLRMIYDTGASGIILFEAMLILGSTPV